MEDKVCLITGASAGSLGEGISKCLAEAGFRRLVLVARTKEKLEKTAAACRAAGAKEVLVLPKDLSMVESTKQLVKEVEEKFGRLDVLVHAAGIDKITPVEKLEIEDAERIMKLNYIIPLALTKESLPLLRKTKGNVVFITAAVYHLATFAASGAPKAALLLLSKVLALEEAPNGVRSNSVSPGFICTDGALAFAGTDDREKAEAVMKGAQPLSQVGRPEDIGRAVAFLADETKSGFATGTDINIDGGYKLVPKSA